MTNLHHVVLGVPAEYTLGVLNVWSPQAQLAFSNTGNTINITVTALSSDNLSMSIEGLTNPTVQASSSWSLSLYKTGAILVASGSTTQQFSAVCGSVCRSCLNTSYSLTCYNNSLVNSLLYLDDKTKTCVSSCFSSQYIHNTSCYDCNSNCLTCDVLSINCTSCGGSLLLYDGKCIANCPENYYSQGSLCLTCPTNCRTCASSSVCVSCLDGFVLSGSSCLAVCPSGSYNSSNFCVSCPNNCTSCS